MKSLIGFFRKMKEGTEQENYGRDIVLSMVKDHSQKNISRKLRILDLGVGQGEDFLNIRNSFGKEMVDLYGVECWGPYIKEVKKKGINVFSADIERDQLPFKDAFFDVVIANQIIEHTKEIFWIFSEISRVLKKDGIAIIGVPNLAALHNRILLLLGNQPSCVKMLGPHVRGVTKNSFMEFVTEGGYFNVTKVKGSNFYPFPKTIARPLSSLFPTFSVCLFFVCQRTGKEGLFVEVLKNKEFETNYFEGDKKLGR